MARFEKEEPDFSKIHCWECNKEMETSYSVFFIDENGCNRYGAVCKKCYPKVKARRITVVYDGIVSLNKVTRNATAVLNKALKKSKK